MKLIQTSGNGSYSAHNSIRPHNFYCVAPQAKSVCIVGDFNNWTPVAMASRPDGWWLAQISLCHGHHQYRFMVDGKPMLDPTASGITRNENGEEVSLVAVS